MNKATKVRINNIDIKDYINMRLKGLSTSVKWKVVKDLEMSNGETFSQNCLNFRRISDEIVHDEPNQKTLKVIADYFNLYKC